MKKLLLLTMLLLLASCGGNQNNWKLTIDNWEWNSHPELVLISWDAELNSTWKNNNKYSQTEVVSKPNSNIWNTEKKIWNLVVNISTTGAIYKSWNLIWLSTGANICLKENEWFLCKSWTLNELEEKNWKIFFKWIKTIQEIQNKNYKPVRWIIYKCNGSLYQIKNWKNLPWYYCKTNWKDYLEQYEFIDNEWDKVCIKRLWNKDYFEIKKIDSDSILENIEIDIPLYSKETLDITWDNSDCSDLKSMFYVWTWENVEEKKKEDSKEINKLKNIKVVAWWWWIDKKFEYKTNEIKYVFDFDWISKIWFEYSGYTCTKIKWEELIYTWDDFGNYLCFKWFFKEEYLDFWFYFPFQATFVYDEKYIIKSNKSLLEICKDVFNIGFTIQWNYCYWYKLVKYSEPSWDWPAPGHYVSYLTIKWLWNKKKKR